MKVIARLGTKTFEIAQVVGHGDYTTVVLVDDDGETVSLMFSNDEARRINPDRYAPPLRGAGEKTK